MVLEIDKNNKFIAYNSYRPLHQYKEENGPYIELTTFCWPEPAARHPIFACVIIPSNAEFPAFSLRGMQLPRQALPDYRAAQSYYCFFPAASAQLLKVRPDYILPARR